MRAEDREQLQQHLAAANIATAIHYPVPLHLQTAYAKLGYQAGDFPIAERCAAEIVSLPMFPGLTREQQELVVTGVMGFPSTAHLAAAHAGARY